MPPDDSSDAQDFDTISGKGVIGQGNGRRVALGNNKPFADKQIDLGPLASLVEALRGEGQTVVFMAVVLETAGTLVVVGRAPGRKASALDDVRNKPGATAE